MEISKSGKISEFLIAILFILFGAGIRLLPHIPNFTPIAAIALFGGACLSKKTAIFLPLLAMGISDIFLGFYDIKLMAAVYGSFLLCVIIGFWLKANKKWYRVGGSAILSSVLFFLITNFAVWVFTPWYTKDFPGIIQCYLLALPFFRNTLLGDLFYTSLFFGAYELTEIWIRKTFKEEKGVVFT